MQIGIRLDQTGAVKFSLDKHTLGSRAEVRTLAVSSSRVHYKLSGLQKVL